MVKPKIAIVNSKSFGVHTDALQRLSSIGEVTRIEVPRDIPGRDLALKLKGYHFVVASVTPKYDRDFFEFNESVVMIVRHGIGYDNIDVKAAEEKGVIVARVPGWREREAVAEHAIALMLSALRYIPQAYNAVRAGRWGDRAKYVGKELSSLTVGIIGFGNIGSRVAEILKKGFNSRIVVYDPYAPRDKIIEAGYEYAENLCELLKNSDVITLHAALTPENYHMIDEKAFECMKDGVIIVNTARGELIDEKSLIENIKKGKVLALATDVVEGEPISADHPLLKHENIIITPHIAAYTWEALRGMDDAVVEAITNYLNKKPIDGIVVMPKNPRKLILNH
ncbi:MAG: D-isomer specific 2-hydroxyacid dehydrogenase family protein [Desulfurococcaceae archaeon]